MPSQLQSLNLFSNYLGDKGVEDICKASFSTNTSLFRLDLSYNGIGNRGAVVLAQILRSPSCTIEELDLDENQIEEEGIVQLLASLDQNSNILGLSLAGNPGLVFPYTQELQRLVERNIELAQVQDERAVAYLATARKVAMLNFPYEIKTAILGFLQVSANVTQANALSQVLLDRASIGKLPAKDVSFSARFLKRICLQKVWLEESSRVVCAIPVKGRKHHLIDLESCRRGIAFLLNLSPVWGRWIYKTAFSRWLRTN
ncbi:hypothetical protein HDV03_003258 [Kappamyces sp. JEL0829]|nr:hypothetical protein HDV03_003258 [Kappamyces sp. JEL0829]